MLRRLVLTLCLLALPAIVQAQTHYCDTAPPTSGIGTVGVTMTVQACALPNDTNGNPVTNFNPSSNAFGQIVAVLDPIVAQVGARLEF